MVRYTALLTGVFYGIVHRQTLQAKFDRHAADNELKKREKWLEEAKKAWAAKQTKSDGGSFYPFPSLFAVGTVVLTCESIKS